MTASEPTMLAEWIERGLQETPGQDPLGLQTITTDRILPQLLPGVLALSDRARYFSIYAFLLRHYERNRVGPPDNQRLSHFILAREYELSIACNLCEHCDHSGAVGNFRVRPITAQRPQTYDRGESVRTALGGYGLYYRSPMDELGLIVPAGRGVYRDEPTPLDLVTDRADPLAEAFEEAIGGTRWYREYLSGIDSIPADVLRELADVACLCRLADHPRERRAIGQALLTAPSPERSEPAAMRRRAFALLLDLAGDDPGVLESTSEFRARVIEAFERSPVRSAPREDTQARWAAMAMRECLQECFASLWHAFCRAGYSSPHGHDGLTPAELSALVGDVLVGVEGCEIGGRHVVCDAGTPSSRWVAEIVEAARDLSWEGVAEWTLEADTALSGLAGLVLLCRLTPDPTSVNPAWSQVAYVDGEHQWGLRRTAEIVQRRLTTDPTVGELMDWTLRTFVIAPHETVAMAKLPYSTFRFWWENGRLLFVDNGIRRFEGSGLRRHALSQISHDLGWWTSDGDRVEIDATLVAEAFA